MNYEYTKKPVTIEAFQMTKERRESNADWPSWLHVAWVKSPDEIGAVYPENANTNDGSNGKDRLRIRTLEGDQLVSFDDFIIKGVQGEIYPCKPDIFSDTYVNTDGSPVVLASGEC